MPSWHGRKAYMTFREFVESGINYGKGYEDIMARIGSFKDNGLRKAIAYCYKSYMGFVILRDLRESKLANKPLHYKVVNDFVAGYTNDFIRFSVTTDTLWHKSSNFSVSIHSRERNYQEYAMFYIGWKDDENRADWEKMDNMLADIVDPADIERLYQDQKKLNDDYVAAIRKMKEDYRKARDGKPSLTEMVYVEVKI